MRSAFFFANHKARRERILRKMAAMRAAKARKRLAQGPQEDEPRMQRFHRLELGVRDKLTGEVAWIDFRSVRDALRRLSVIRRYYL